MNSRVTMGLAVLFLLGALFAGYWGLVLSRQTAPAPQAPLDPAAAPAATPVVAEKPSEDPTRQSVLVLGRDVPAYQPITADDLIVERLKVAPPGSFSKPEDAVGRMSWRPLSAGTWLTDSSFEAGGTLARMIRPGERALALGVDEIIGAGGQLSPGDYVDVLLYLPPDPANNDRSAQTVVPALRVLTVGALMGPVNPGQDDLSVSRQDHEQQQTLRSNARSVVLAVPEQLLNRLMLASQAGPLRLAVRSAEEKNLQRYWAGDGNIATQRDTANRNITHFNQLSLGSTRGTSVTDGAPRGPRPVEIIRGNQTSQQTP
ncbi:Flp pilus assembly protein CpaB [Pseudomonas sp. efr-133-TYG-103a]|jgi:pilus assembly protein CpaB|uniref:Flp pilus assembly protein CpaB n=1 Tax=Pseudomonas sp. efr-133-TYG-103a TaxID=3040308 RepID=UPI0025575CED|nr:Flp pilus assembly protein CpaB [Pseudomonas sp. efr-133-TYG-103a]